MTESVEKYWTGSNTYDPAEFDRSRYRVGPPFWLPHMLRIGEIESGQRVLDIGCGMGGLSECEKILAIVMRWSFSTITCIWLLRNDWVGRLGC